VVNIGAGPTGLFLWTTALIYGLFALSTNVLFGWSGMASFGQAAFFGAGAYTVAMLRNSGINSIVVMVIGALVAGVLAALFARLAMRVEGIGFAMLTLVFSQVLFLLTFHLQALGGENGIPSIPRGGVLGLSLGTDDVFWWYAVVVAAASVWALRKLQLSNLGAALRAVRDDPIRAVALGLPVQRLRILAFTVSGLVAGVAGAMYAQQQGLVSSDALGWQLSGEVIIMAVLGGTSIFFGPLFGGVAFTFGSHYLFQNTKTPELYLGLVFLFVVLFMPGGLGSLPSLLRSGARRWAKRT
jgi:branched-chain amino acid transport system permease protein